MLENDPRVKSKGKLTRSVICGCDKESVNKPLQGMKNCKSIQAAGRQTKGQTRHRPSQAIISSLAVVKRLRDKTPSSLNLIGYEKMAEANHADHKLHQEKKRKKMKCN